MAPMRIVVADGQGIWRAALEALLEKQAGCAVVGAAASAAELVAAVGAAQPDLAIVDGRLPGGALRAVYSLKEQWPCLGVLVLSPDEDPTGIRAALAAGAAGYARKQARGEELIRAVRAVAARDVYLDPVLVRALVPGSGRGDRATIAPHQALSARETPVLRLIALGYPARAIAGQLGLSDRTVETYKNRLTAKLGCRDRATLVRDALVRGLLDEAAGRHADAGRGRILTNASPGG